MQRYVKVWNPQIFFRKTVWNPQIFFRKTVWNPQILFHSTTISSIKIKESYPALWRPASRAALEEALQQVAMLEAVRQSL